MRFGLCSDRFEYVKSLGFGYVELSLSSIATMSDEEIENMRAELERAQIKAEAFNCFCRSALKLSQDIDLDAIKEYAERALDRASKLGARVIVVGSGSARRISEGYSVEAAEENFKNALCTIADVAAKYGIKIAIEPLNVYDCNFINTLADAAKICRAANRENIGIIADIYHMHRNGEELSEIVKYGDHISHIHVARMNDDRGAPTLADADMMKNVLAVLEEIAYDGRASLEASCKPDFETAASNYAELLKTLNLI